MALFKSRRKGKVFRPTMLLQQLEERIVLDAAVTSAVDDQSANQADAGAGHTQTGKTATDQVATGGAGQAGNAAAEAPSIPTSYDHVFNDDLNVVLISNQLGDVQAISDAAASNAKVIVYDAQHDNLSTITAQLQDLVNATGHTIDNLAIVGHGSAGTLYLGTDQILNSTLGQYEGAFHALSASLSENAQIQFYACSLAGNATGQELVNSIATFTSADVFASTDTTGGNAYDWTLEYATDATAAMHTLLDADALAAYNAQLAVGIPVLVKDINTLTTSYPAQTGYASDYATMGGKVFFSAADGIASTDSYGEPFVYDLTTGEAALLKDISPYSSVPKYFTVSGGKLFFQATDWVHGYELFVSDGIPGGDTHMIFSANGGINANAGNSTPTSLTDVNGTLYFLATDGTPTTSSLWRTDGTDPNTVEFAAGSAYNPLGVSSIANLTNVNGTLYFTGTSTSQGVEVYKIDSLTGNITYATTINPTATPTALTAVGSSLYFTANNGSGLTLWSIDSTTGAVAQIPNSYSITTFANLTNVNGTLFFDGNTGATNSNQELYKVTGGAEVLVQDIRIGGSSNPENLTAVGSTVYFTANDGTGIALWQSDGTIGGATKVANLAGSDAVTSFTNLTNINGKLYFTGSSASTGSELYKVEAGSIALAQDIYAGATGSGPTALTNIGGGKVIFTANDGFTGNEPWVYDGTSPATSLDINHLGGSTQWLTNVNGILYFVASDGGHGMELWKSDPATGVTSMVMDLSAGSANGIVPYSSNAPIVNVNGTLFFLGSESTQAAGALYKMDNSTGLPVKVKDVASGTEWLTNLTAFENTLYFVNYSAGGNYLWRSDGTEAGTVQVTDPSGATIQGPSTYYFTEFNGTLYFQGGKNGFTLNGSELYKIDADGNQVLVQDLAPGNYVGSAPENLINVNGTLYFTATVNNVKGIYYTSDGVTINQVIDNIGVTVPTTPWLTNHNGTLYFSGSSTADGAELFYVDPVAHTIGVVNVAPLAASSSPTDLFSANGKLYFAATDSTYGKEPWVYDGTNAVMLKDINLNAAMGAGSPTSFTYMDGLVYFRGINSGYSETELYQTDGTPAGTKLAGDIEINPTTTGSNPTSFTVVNNTLFFVATGPGIGAELYKVDGAGTNDLPTASNMNQTLSIGEDGGALSLQTIFVEDLDGTDTITATLSLDKPAAGALSSAAGGTYNARTGFWSITGDATTVNAALAGVSFTPTADWNGTVNITTHVHDAKMTGPTNGLITVNVTPVNDAASASPVTVTLNEDTTTPVEVVLSGSPGPANEQDQFVTFTLDLTGMSGQLFRDAAGLDPILTLTDTVTTLTPGLTSVSVYYLPDPEYAGTTSFTYTAGDDGGVAGQGTSTPAGVTIDVAAVNDLPVNVNIPGAQDISEDAVKVFSAALGNAISISDVDLNNVTPPSSHVYSVTFTTAKTGVGDISSVPLYPGQVANTGNVWVTETARVTVTGNNSASVTVTGTLDAINEALSLGLEFRPYAEGYAYSGTSNALLTMVTSDGGNIADPPNSPIALTATSTIDFTVTPVADAPVSTLGTFNVAAGTPQVTLSPPNGIHVHDGDVNDTLFVQIQAGTGISSLGWGTSSWSSPNFVFVGTEAMLNSLLSHITANIQPGFYGTAEVQVIASDIGGSSTIPGAVTINVAPGPLAPQLTIGDTGYTIWEDTATPMDLSNCVHVTDPNGDPLSIDLVAPVGSGWASLNAAGPATVTPIAGGINISGLMADVQASLLTLSGTLETNFNGTASFNVSASDGTHLTTDVVNLPVALVNDAPVATTVAVTGNEDAAIAVTFGMTDPNDVGFAGGANTLASVNIVTGPAHGTLTHAFGAPPGDWTYTPNANWNGTDTFTYTVTDNGTTTWGGQPTSALATGTITVNPVNDAPVAIAGITGSGLEDNPITLGLGMAGDPLDTPPNSLLSINIATQPAHGHVDFIGGNWVYTPTANWFGSDTFSYTVTDGGGTLDGGVDTSAPESVTVNVFSLNDAPVALPVTVTAIQGTPTTITLGMTDPADAAGPGLANSLAAVLATMPAHGSLQFTADPATWIYTPNAGYVGPDSFTYFVQDNGGTNDGGVDISVAPATVNITVNSPANTVPTASNMTQLHAVLEDSGPLNLTDVVVTDPDVGDTITASLTLNETAAGSLSSSAGLYDPASGIWTFSGSASAVNAALANATFTANANWNGTATITTHVQDAALTGPADGLITIGVTAVSDAPVANTGILGTGNEDTTIAVTLGMTDPNDTPADTLQAVTIVTGPAHGTLTHADGAATGDWTYTPNADWNGTDTFTYTVQDAGTTANGGGNVSATATGTITVNPVNDAPTATNMDQNPTILEDSGPLNLTDIVVTDPDVGDIITASLTLNETTAGSLSSTTGLYDPATGIWTVSGSAGAVNTALADATFTPNANWNGTATITTHVNDAALTGPANGLITVGVTAANDAPTASNMTQLHAVLEDSGPLNLTDVVVTDPDVGDTITASLTLNETAAGSLSSSAGVYDPATGIWTVSGSVSAVNTALADATFTPNANWNGTATITTHVNDAALTGPANGLITVGVTSMNDAPVANAGIVISGNENTAIAVTLGMTDPTDAAGPSGANSLLRANIVSGPAHGTLTHADGAAPGDWTYTPNADWAGTDTFTYTVTDDGTTANGGVDTSTSAETVTINVTGVNSAPVNHVPTTVLNTIQGSILAFNGANTISVTDADAGTAAIQMDITATNGRLYLATGQVIPPGLTVTGNGTSAIHLTGSQADINTVINGLQFRTSLSYVGPATIAVATSDLGHSPEPAATDSDIININVIKR